MYKSTKVLSAIAPDSMTELHKKATHYPTPDETTSPELSHVCTLVGLEIYNALTSHEPR